MKYTLKQQRGSSLLYVILLLGIMLIIAFSMSVLSVSELRITGVNQKSQKAFYLAEAGIERSLYELSIDPAGNGKSVSPVVVDDTTGDFYRYCYGECSSAPAPEIDTLTFSLNTNDSKKIFLFQSENLQDPAFVPAGTTVDFQCSSGCSGLSASDPTPALEVKTYAFNPATVSSFDLGKLTQSNLTTSADTLDESSIDIKTYYFEDMTLYASPNQTSDALPVADTSAASPRLYMLELHGLKGPATYVVKFSETLTQENTPTIQSFGETANGVFDGNARRGIEISYSRTKDSLDIFNYTLFEGDDIEKFAK